MTTNTQSSSKPLNLWVPHHIYEKTIYGRFSGNERFVIDQIVRFQYGFPKLNKSLIKQRDIIRCGLPKSSASLAISSLKRKNIIVKDREGHMGLNENVDQWKCDSRDPCFIKEYRATIKYHIFERDKLIKSLENGT